MFFNEKVDYTYFVHPVCISCVKYANHTYAILSIVLSHSFDTYPHTINIMQTQFTVNNFIIEMLFLFVNIFFLSRQKIV